MVKSKRTRRGFSSEFKLEAVRRVLERTASGVSVAQLGRKLNVRPDLLRAWVRQAQERILRETVAMSDKYAAIAWERHRFPVALMCAALGVSPSGFYAAQQRPASARACRVERLRLVTRAAFAAVMGRQGSPRIFGALTDAGEQTSEKLIACLMQEEGLVARAPRRYVVTTDSDHREPIAPNLLARDFAVRDSRALDTAWVSDIPYVPTRAGYLYLAAVLDLASQPTFL